MRPVLAFACSLTSAPAPATAAAAAAAVAPPSAAVRPAAAGAAAQHHHLQSLPSLPQHELQHAAACAAVPSCCSCHCWQASRRWLQGPFQHCCACPCHCLPRACCCLQAPLQRCSACPALPRCWCCSCAHARDSPARAQRPLACGDQASQASCWHGRRAQQDPLGTYCHLPHLGSYCRQRTPGSYCQQQLPGSYCRCAA